MPGRGDGDGGMAKGHAKKRDLDDELRVGLGAGNPDAKRRHTAGGHGQRDDDGTSNSSSFQVSRRDAKRYGTSKFPESQLNTLQASSRPSSSLPALQRQHSSRSPNSTGSAAKAPGALGASAASGSSWGAKSGGPEGVFTRQDRPTWKQKPLPNGPPTLPSTSSDASSIPAGSTKDDVLPASRAYVSISSDDGSYVDDEEEEDSGDEDDDENAISLPTTRQGSTRLRARSGGEGPLKGHPDDDLGGKHSTKLFSYDKTPSGKDYHEFSSESPTTVCLVLPANVFQTRTRRCAMQSGHYFLTGTGCNMYLTSDALTFPAQSEPAQSDTAYSRNSTDISG